MSFPYSKLLTYDMKVSRRVSVKTRGWEFRDKQALNCVIMNLCSCVRKGKTLSYSRNKYEVNTSKKKLTPHRVMKVVDFLSDKGYIVNTVGTSHKVESLRGLSSITPTKKFIEEFNFTEEVFKEIEMDYVKNADVVILRDNSKAQAKYFNSDVISGMVEEVKALNLLNHGLDVRDGDGVPLDNIYCRIFNETFDFGGRYYRADILTIPNKQNERLDVTINGKQVVEVDYSNLHIRLAGVMENYDLNKLGDDAYVVALDDEHNLVHRNVVKIAINIMFNCKNRKQAYGAITKVLNSLTEEEKSKYTLGTPKEVVDLIFKSYPEFAVDFCSSEYFGKILQNADSHLASDVIREFVGAKKPILPIHDSFITTVDNLDFLCNTMGKCFRQRFEVNVGVPMSVKFKKDGEITSYSIVEYS